MEQERNKLSIPPTTLSFITTNKCTAACKNCCFGCNPKNNMRLSLSVMKNHVDEAVKSYPTIRSLVLTGGECFTLGGDLLAISSMPVRGVTEIYEGSLMCKRGR